MASQRRGIPTFFVALMSLLLYFTFGTTTANAQERVTGEWQSASGLASNGFSVVNAGKAQNVSVSQPTWSSSTERGFTSFATPRNSSATDAVNNGFPLYVAGTIVVRCNTTAASTLGPPGTYWVVSSNSSGNYDNSTRSIYHSIKFCSANGVNAIPTAQAGNMPDAIRFFAVPCGTSTCASPTAANTNNFSQDAASFRLYADILAVAARVPPVVTAGNCILTDAQLAGLARAAGFPEAQLNTAVAVALAESGGRVNAINTNPSPVTYDIGLWQINETAHPSYNKQMLGINPIFNATAAKEIWQAANAGAGAWTPWSAFKNGSYSKFSARANTGITESAGQSFALTNCSGGTANPGDTDGNGVIDVGAQQTECEGGWNPLGYIKCALIFVFVPKPGAISGWTTKAQGISQKPPISIVTFIYNTCKNIFSEDTSNSFTITTGDGGSISGGVAASAALPGSTKQYAFAPLTQAGDLVTNNTWAQFAYILAKFGIIVLAFFGMRKRISASFGGKDATGNDN